MTKKILNYKYLLNLYAKIDRYLSDRTHSGEEFEDIVISFCIFVERTLKIKLYRKNPVLVFNTGTLKEDNIAYISTGGDVDICTIEFKTTLNRFRYIYKKKISENEAQVLTEIYTLRNSLIHSYKCDEDIIYSEDDIIKKMGTLWEVLSVISKSVFGKKLIKGKKPSKMYSKAELDQALKDEVRKMIRFDSLSANFKLIPKIGNIGFFDYNKSTDFDLKNIPLNVVDSTSQSILDYAYGGVTHFDNFSGKTCPRCHKSFSLVLGSGRFDLYSNINEFEFYRCKNCNLELTQKQYEIAKEITQSYI